MTQYATAQEILDAANAELGLPQVAFGASSTDQTGRQAAALMTAIGNDLVRLHDWQFLLYEATFTGNGTQTRFPLPTDFGRVVNQTMWSTQGLDYPVIGPESPQVWGWLKYGAYGGGVYYRYRIVGNEIEVFPAPGNGQQFSFAYITKNWAYANNANKTPKDVVNAGDDTPIFNARLMISGLKARLWGQKGFDTTQVQGEFNSVLLSEKSVNQGAPVIALAGTRDPYYITTRNIPEGGWG